MGAIETDRTQRRFNQRLEGSALEIQHFQAAAAWQKQVARKAYGRARQDHVAELEHARLGPAILHLRADIGLVAWPVVEEPVGQRRRQFGNHVAYSIAYTVSALLLLRVTARIS